MTGLSACDRAYLAESCNASGVPVALTDKNLLVDLADDLREDVARGSEAA